MTRNEFIKVCGVLGVSISFQSSFAASLKGAGSENTFTGKVIIIGAGAGGISVGYLLQQQGIDFEILEASLIYGGRMRIDTSFTDFPIPLGAEWLETDTGVFQKIVNDSSIQVNIKTTPDKPDHKFVNYSWYNFFEEYIIPSISNKISYNTIVQSVDYSGDQVVITTKDGQRIADKIIVSVPLKILQDGDIRFQPTFPKTKLDAINNTTIWEGFKAFFEFSNKFYDEENAFTISPSSDGEKIYYDATLGQKTSKNILGLFVVGKPALDYISLSNDELKSFILNELDGLYSNQATPNYVNHITQNWNDEPFIKSGYMTDDADWRTVKVLGKSVADKIYFAGGPYTDGEDWVSVHAAAHSAKKTIAEIIN